MRKIYELDLCSGPGLNLPPDAGRLLERLVRAELPVAAGMVFGLSFIANAADISNLGLAIEEGALSELDFRRFCRHQGLSSALSEEERAARFLEYCYGRELAWVHLPHDQQGVVALQALLEWSASRGYCLQDTHYGFCWLPSTNAEMILTGTAINAADSLWPMTKSSGGSRGE